MQIKDLRVHEKFLEDKIADIELKIRRDYIPITLLSCLQQDKRIFKEKLGKVKQQIKIALDEARNDAYPYA